MINAPAGHDFRRRHPIQVANKHRKITCEYQEPQVCCVSQTDNEELLLSLYTQSVGKRNSMWDYPGQYRECIDTQSAEGIQTKHERRLPRSRGFASRVVCRPLRYEPHLVSAPG